MKQAMSRFMIVRHHVVPSSTSVATGRKGKIGRGIRSFSQLPSIACASHFLNCHYSVVANSVECLKSVPERTTFIRSFRSSTLKQSNASSKPDTKENEMVTTNNEFLPGKLIDFQVQSKIEGEESHVATIDLYPGEILRAESGSMIFMTEGVVMETKMNSASSAFTRYLTGQNVFLTDFHYEGTSKGTICLGTDFPSKILRFSLDEHPNSSLICQRGAYLASNSSVNIEMEFTKTLTSGFFGGQGFILQKLSGVGDVLVKGGGTIKKIELQPNETLRVSSGCIVAFESTISYDVTMMPGIQNAMFGGEGLFITTLIGPGYVWLQGMPPDRMIAEIARRIPSGSPIGFGIPIGIGGGGGGGDATTPTDGPANAGGDGVGADTSQDSATSSPTYDEGAIAADRNATVASSGVDSDSPSALFGDAVDDNDVASTDASMDSNTSQFDDQVNPSSSIDPFQEDSFSTSTSSSTSESLESEPFDKQVFGKDGELVNDDGSNIGNDSTSATTDVGGGGDEESKSIFKTLWDFFTGED